MLNMLILKFSSRCLSKNFNILIYYIRHLFAEVYLDD